MNPNEPVGVHTSLEFCTSNENFSAHIPLDVSPDGAILYSTPDVAREKERQLAALSVEIQNMRAADSTHDATITALQRRIDELSVELEIQTQELQRERRLLAASRDIRELMGARNLHIVDVYDVDGRGKTQQSFGRVFYTEVNR